MIVNEPENMRIDVRKIGSEQHGAVVIDNFLADPDQVRKDALELSFEKPDYPYPGLISIPDWEFKGIMKTVEGLLGNRFIREQYIFRLSMVTVAEPELEDCQTMPHVDPVTVAGLVYLSPPQDCFGGTAFYRHRATGVEQLPARPDPAYLEKMKQFGFSDIREWTEHLLSITEPSKGFITDSNKEWELLELVEMKYNRLLIYNGKLFHSGYIKDGKFGKEKEQRRLTLNFFIRGT